jgi:hypothetical protein
MSLPRTGERLVLDVNKMSFMCVLIAVIVLSIRKSMETAALSAFVRAGLFGDFFQSLNKDIVKL